MTQDIVDFIKLIGMQTAHFIFTIDPSTPKYIQADENKLRQVIINLLGNGIKFTDQGKVELKVALSEFSTENYKLLFTIQDTGVGIDSQELDSLFKPFQQTKSGQQLQQGTSLDLALSKQFIELMFYHDSFLQDNSEQININLEEIMSEFLTMPTAWLQQLYQYCLTLDEYECDLLIEQIPESNFKFKLFLIKLKKKLAFEKLLIA